jgi:hypothetical protein
MWNGKAWSVDACAAAISAKQPPPSTARSATKPDARYSEASSKSNTDTHDPGAMRVVRDHVIGCHDRSVYERIVHISVQGDNEAAGKAILFGVAGGYCRMLDLGSDVYMDDHAWFSGLVKVRLRGQIDGYWTAIENVQ